MLYIQSNIISIDDLGMFAERKKSSFRKFFYEVDRKGEEEKADQKWIGKIQLKRHLKLKLSDAIALDSEK